MSVHPKYGTVDDDDVYYYIRWRLKLEGTVIQADDVRQQREKEDVEADPDLLRVQQALSS